MMLDFTEVMRPFMALSLVGVLLLGPALALDYIRRHRGDAGER